MRPQTLHNELLYRSSQVVLTARDGVGTVEGTGSVAASTWDTGARGPINAPSRPVPRWCRSLHGCPPSTPRMQRTCSVYSISPQYHACSAVCHMQLHNQGVAGAQAGAANACAWRRFLNRQAQRQWRPNFVREEKKVVYCTVRSGRFASARLAHTLHQAHVEASGLWPPTGCSCSSSFAALAPALLLQHLLQAANPAVPWLLPARTRPQGHRRSSRRAP